jgi:hypothetical protein
MSEISSSDAAILRPLAEQVARIAALPAQEERRQLWRRLNRLERVRPLLYIHRTQFAWHEFDLPELALRCAGELARHAESQLRRALWRHRHCIGDDVTEPLIWIIASATESGWGLPSQPRRPEQRFGAAEFPPVIHDFPDVERICASVVIPQPAKTQSEKAALESAMGGMIKVEAVYGAAPALWDMLIQWYGTNELMLDLVERPDLVHAAASRLTTAIVTRMKQIEALGLLTLNNGRHEAGAGGPGYTDELPQSDFEGRVRLRDLWGNQMAQIFTGVSPAMHDEFALRYETQILEHFGLNAYGCCEPLHHKVGVIRKIPRLRRISMSPWVDWEAGAAAIGQDYVFSAKPNPAFLAGDKWDPRPVEAELRRILEATRGLRLEIVLKDLHTFRGEPHRIVAWHELATKLIAEYA